MSRDLDHLERDLKAGLLFPIDRYPSTQGTIGELIAELRAARADGKGQGVVPIPPDVMLVRMTREFVDQFAGYDAQGHPLTLRVEKLHDGTYQIAAASNLSARRKEQERLEELEAFIDGVGKAARDLLSAAENLRDRRPSNRDSR